MLALEQIFHPVCEEKKIPSKCIGFCVTLYNQYCMFVKCVF